MPSTVDATDLELVDAVQLQPRAPWSAIAERLGLTETTVARRWKRLHRERLAWTGVALHPAASKGAFIEIRCRIENVDALTEALCAIPDVITVGHTTGDFNLYCIVIGVSLDGVLARVESGLPDLVRSERVRVNLFHQIAGGVDWRQGLLPIPENPPADRRQASIAPGEDMRSLLLALGEDARITAQSAAERLGTSPAALARRISRLEDQRQIVFRCDVARPAFDYPIAMLLSFRVPPLLVEQFALQVGSWREVRFCASVASTANFIVIAGLRDLPDGERFIARVLQLEVPAELVGRAINTRMSKVYGRLLDRDGRARACVPPDPWAGLSSNAQ